MVQSSHQSTDGWGFTRPFSWSLWLALLLTLLVVPPLIFLIEFWSLRRHIHRCAEAARRHVCMQAGMPGSMQVSLPSRRHGRNTRRASAPPRHDRTGA